MEWYKRFRSWAKKNAPLRRLLGIVLIGTAFMLTHSIWVTFATLVLWLCLTQ